MLGASCNARGRKAPLDAGFSALPRQMREAARGLAFCGTPTIRRLVGGENDDLSWLDPPITLDSAPRTAARRQKARLMASYAEKYGSNGR
jgi:hypothetical protein